MESIRIATDSWWVEVMLAERFLDRLRGIRGVPPGQGIALRSRAIHTFGLDHCLGAFGVDGTGTVVAVDSLTPNRLFYFRGARLVVELPAGSVLPAQGETVAISHV